MEDLLESRPRGRVGELIGDGLRAIPLLQVAEPDLFVHERFFEIFGGTEECGFDGLVRIHLQDEMGSPLQVEAERDLVSRKVLFPEFRKVRDQRRCQKEQGRQANDTGNDGADGETLDHRKKPLYG